MSRELTVAASGACSFIEFAVSTGADRQALLRRSGIDSAILQDRDNRLPFSKYVALIRAGKALCANPAIALHFGEAVDCSEIAVPVGGATNFDDAVKVGNRYAPLAIEVEHTGAADRFTFERLAGHLWFVDNRINPNDFPELTESAFARMVCSIRRLMGDVSVIKAMQVTHAEPSYRGEYDRIFRVPVTFESCRNGMHIDEVMMARFPFPKPSTYVNGVLQNHAEALLKKLESSQSTRGRVEELLVPILHTSDVSIDAIAGELGLSRQTLFRKLKSEGVTFQQVIDDLRHRLALHYLISEKASVKRTARVVGFSDPTAFSRAFKRWTGSAPSEYVASRQPAPAIAQRPRPSRSARE